MNTHPLFRSVLTLAALLAVNAFAGDGTHDETYPVSKGSRLVVGHVLGTLVVIGWDRDEVHVEADYDPDSYELEVRDRGLRFQVELVALRGLGGYGDIELHVPAWMPVEISGHEVDVEVEQMESSLEIDLVGGDVFVEGGRESVHVESVHGGIEIHDAVADLELSSTHEDIELRDCRGDVRIESVNGDVRMAGLETSSVEIETTNGDVLLDGILDPAGDYEISTHSGNVAVSIAPDADLTITIDTYHGDVQSALDAEIEEIREGKRYRMVLGEGRGRMVIESFQGDITLYDPKLGRRKRG